MLGDEAVDGGLQIDDGAKDGTFQLAGRHLGLYGARVRTALLPASYTVTGDRTPVPRSTNGGPRLRAAVGVTGCA